MNNRFDPSTAHHRQALAAQGIKHSQASSNHRNTEVASD